ncbi:hypothetical protein TNCV_421011 [Trichonephila clavipes]|nr:hypothetical protein TNCV_421011 [Trichonephila clavipes]
MCAERRRKESSGRRACPSFVAFRWRKVQVQINDRSSSDDPLPVAAVPVIFPLYRPKSITVAAALQTPSLRFEDKWPR